MREIVIYTVIDIRYDPKANGRHDNGTNDDNCIGDHMFDTSYIKIKQDPDTTDQIHDQT